MYVLTILLGLGAGGLLLANGRRRRSAALVVAGAAVAFGVLVFFPLLGLVGELLWFEALGFAGRFWTEVVARCAGAALGALAAGLGVFVLTLPLPGKPAFVRRAARLVAAIYGALWGFTRWDVLLRFLHRRPTDLVDPILGRDTAFYFFTLPFYDALYQLLFITLLIPLVAWLALRSLRCRRRKGGRADPLPSESPWAKFCAATPFAAVLAWGKYLDVFHLMYSTEGAVHGPGWTDVHVRLPAYYVAAVLTVVVGIVAFVPPVAARLERRWPSQRSTALPAPAAAAVAGIGLTWLVLLGFVPRAVQWLRVEPNEISFEKPYIAHNIALTRIGFGLDRIEEREFPAAETLTRQALERNDQILSEVRLWDWRALDAVYQQFQEIRLYYEFADVDIDRYRMGDDYREVMVSAREMEIDNLPADSQTFINRRFKYTHGYGITLATVSDFTPEGLPELLVHDVPPVSERPELEIAEPSIYYGELTREHVIVNSSEEEFQFPQGDENRYTRYQGTGGVEISGLWRKLVFGWKFDGTRLLLSSYPRRGSRILFHRQILDRVRTLAPFLVFDDDPYIALVNGRLYWIVDAYTTSRYFPYSEPFRSRERIEHAGGTVDRVTLPRFEGQNYVRNAVKATIDAYSGEVTFYVFEPEDPLIRVWQRIFPDLFRPRGDMPEDLERHVRYPEGLQLAQGLVYAKYHMEDPEVFYNQEDLWVRATEKYYAQVQPVEPYYVMWKPAEAERVGFTQILPFTPKGRQVLIGWIAGLCDPPDYGRLLAYKFPKEKRVLGPQQVETKIDQDSYLSAQLSLWDQRGSTVIRGNVLAIPIDDTLLYVEPIYLRAETAAYPELRLVAVMHGDRLSYAKDLAGALDGLFAETEPPRPPLATPAAAPGESLARRAQRAFESYLRLQGEGKLREAAEQLEQLRDLLSQMVVGEEDERE